MLSSYSGSYYVLRAKRGHVALRLCLGASSRVSDKLVYARLSQGITQQQIVEDLGIERSKLIRYENGQIAENNMDIHILKQIAVYCNKDKYFCCSPYHIFLDNNPGEKIKLFRQSFGLNKKQWADKFRVSKKTVNYWESNKQRPPAYIFSLVSDFLNTRYYQFINDNPGVKVTIYRENLGLTQKEWAVKLNVSHETISRWEINQAAPPIFIYKLIKSFFDSYSSLPLCKKIKIYRKFHCLSQKEWAAQLHTHHSTILKWESGLHTPPAYIIDLVSNFSPTL